MLRYKLTIGYRGTHYHGWQKQMAVHTWKGPTPPPGHGIPTIQEIMARAIGSIVHHPVILIGSSRTDSGVHAKAQVAHFDTDQAQIPPEGLRRAVNHRLPADMLIRSIEPVPKTFDAIASTISKRYQYAVWADIERNPFAPGLAWHRWQPLNSEAMSEAAAQFVGTRDFTSVARPGHGRGTSVRTILSCDVSRRGPLMVIGIEGTGFLWNMVRIIAGTLVEVGLGTRQAGDMARMLDARDRRAAGGTAPPEGLYLQWIKFRSASDTAVNPDCNDPAPD